MAAMSSGNAFAIFGASLISFGKGGGVNETAEDVRRCWRVDAISNPSG